MRTKFIYIIACSFLILSSCYLTISTPIFAWDTLSFWAPQAVNFVNDNYALVEPAGARHPMGLPLILAFVAKAAEFIGTAAHLIFLILFMFAIVIAVMFSGIKYEERATGIIFILLCFATPLLENHLHIIGYTEILACIGSFIFVTALSAIFDGRGYLGTFSAAFAGAVLLIFSRNTGWFVLVVAALVTTAVFASSFNKKQRLFIGVASITIIIIGVALIKISSGFSAPEPFASVEENERRFVGLRQCDSGVRDATITVRALDAQRKDLPAVGSKSSFPAASNVNDLGIDCLFPLDDLPRDTTMVLLELYSVDGILMNWAYLYPDTIIMNFGQSLRILYGRIWRIEAFGWTMQPAFPEYKLVLNTFFQAIIKNASFSMLFLTTLVSALWLRLTRVPHVTVTAHFWTYWALLFVYIVTQFILDRMFKYSVPNGDTFGSRFLLIGSLHALFGVSLTLCSFISHQSMERGSPDGSQPGHA